MPTYLQRIQGKSVCVCMHVRADTQRDNANVVNVND